MFWKKAARIFIYFLGWLGGAPIVTKVCVVPKFTTFINETGRELPHPLMNALEREQRGALGFSVASTWFK